MRPVFVSVTPTKMHIILIMRHYIIIMTALKLQSHLKAYLSIQFVIVFQPKKVDSNSYHEEWGLTRHQLCCVHSFNLLLRPFLFHNS
jgi:DNA integrity scanning protein DisA with diadenylate cyclase activity